MAAADGITGQGQQNHQSDATDGLFVWTNDSLKAATHAQNGQWLAASDSSDVAQISSTRITTDTRKIQPGDVFLAIIGENFDGHKFVNAAAEKGAVAAIVSKPSADTSIPQLQVDDTRLAFGDIAAYRRQQHTNLKVIAITGSSGKTTVKEMLRSIFMQAEMTQTQNNAAGEPGHSTLVTRGNLNNDFGVPMMLLELANHHQYAVLELGANHVGEIAYTAAMVQPDVACILNIGTAHLGEFGGRDNIAKTKAEIYQPLTEKNTAVIPFDDDYTETLTTTASQHTPNMIQFGWQSMQEADTAPVQFGSAPQVYATQINASATQNTFKLHFASSNMPAQNGSHDEQSQTAAEQRQQTVTLPMAGLHNVSNALAAAACAYAIGIEPAVIAAGLNQSKSIKGRLGRQRLGMHHIIDDTYNANPNSMRAAADVLAAQDGFKILVLGDIGELGDAAQDEHTKLGQAISEKQVDMLLCVGELASNTLAGAQAGGMQAAHAFATKAELLSYLEDVLAEKTAQNQICTLLFKGSRSATMETLIDDLTIKAASFAAP